MRTLCSGNALRDIDSRKLLEEVVRRSLMEEIAPAVVMCPTLPVSEEPTAESLTLDNLLSIVVQEDIM